MELLTPHAHPWPDNGSKVGYFNSRILSRVHKLLGMCYILCTTRCSVCVALGAQAGGGVISPPTWGFTGGRDLLLHRGSLEAPPNFIFFGIFYVHFFTVFQHMVFVDGFLILVKELGLSTNPGQWIRG
jgi:hypothetical protein